MTNSTATKVSFVREAENKDIFYSELKTLFGLLSVLAFIIFLFIIVQENFNSHEDSSNGGAGLLLIEIAQLQEHHGGDYSDPNASYLTGNQIKESGLIDSDFNDYCVVIDEELEYRNYTAYTTNDDGEVFFITSSISFGQYYPELYVEDAPTCL